MTRTLKQWLFTSAPSCEYNHAAVFGEVDYHLHRELLSYQFPIWTNGVRRPATSEYIDELTVFLFLNPPARVFFKEIYLGHDAL